MNVKQSSETLIKTVHYEWNELMHENESKSITFRVICNIATHSGLSVEGSHIFTIHNISQTEDKNALAVTSESAAYNNAIQCLTAAVAFGNQTLPATKNESL